MTLTLPWPPSMNHYYTIARGRKILSTEAREYHKAVTSLLARGRSFRPEHRLCVGITALPPDRRKRDLDNLIKPVLDSLQKAGVFPDDSQIDELSIRRREVSKTPRLLVTITEGGW